MVSFLLALTDERVRYEQEPFDHPALFIPATGNAEGTWDVWNMQRVPAVGPYGVDARQSSSRS